MNIPSISSLNNATKAFANDDIEQSATSLEGDSLSSLSTDKSDMFAGVMDGKLNTGDVESICTVFANQVMTILMPSNPLTSVAAPAVGKSMGKSVASSIPTDVSLFPSPLKSPPVKDASYKSTQSGLTKEMDKIKKDINIDKLPDNMDDTLNNLNYDKQTDGDKTDQQVKLVMDLTTDPMNVFAVAYPEIATQMGMFVPGLKSKADAAKKAKVETDAVKNQLKDELAKGKQKNLTIANSMSVATDKNNAAMQSAISSSIDPFRGYCDDKINTTTNEDQKLYYSDMKKKATNMDVAKVAGDTAKDVDKKQISAIVKQKQNQDGAYYGLRNAWAERQQNLQSDKERDATEAYAAEAFGLEPSSTDSMKRSLATNAKFMAKVVKIYSKAKSGNNIMQNTVSQSLTSKISKEIPEMKPDDVAVFSKTINRQMPSQNAMMQESGIDNLQFTGEKLITQLNVLKTKLSSNGLA